MVGEGQGDAALGSVREHRAQAVEQARPERLEAWRRLGSDLDISKLETISTEISLADAIPAASKLINGEIRGRVIVDVNR